MARKSVILALAAAAAFAFITPPAQGVFLESDELNESSGENTLSFSFHHAHGARSYPSTMRLRLANSCCIRRLDPLYDFLINAHAGSIGNCNAATDCLEFMPDGQIEEGSLSSKYVVHPSTCISGQGGPYDGVAMTFACPITSTEIQRGGVHNGQEALAETVLPFLIKVAKDFCRSMLKVNWPSVSRLG